jgi:hypothetical protein
MIGRIFQPSKSFVRTCQYVAEDLKRAQVIYQDGVRGHDYRLAARDFKMVAALHETIGKPVFHGVLTFHPDEQLDDARKVELALKYFDGVGMENTQRLVVAHRDARHHHVHLVANRIDYDGKAIRNFPEILRGRDTVERLIGEYGLVPVAAKNLRQTNFDALDASDMRKYAIYRSIRESVGLVKDMGELERRLLADGIETRYRLDQAGQRVGVSFLYQNEAFRGSEIDREFSLMGLEKRLGQRQELSQWETQKVVMGERIRQEEQVLKEAEAMRQREAHVVKQKEEQGLKEQEALQQKEILAEKRRQTREQQLRKGLRLRIH